MSSRCTSVFCHPASDATDPNCDSKGTACHQKMRGRNRTRIAVLNAFVGNVQRGINSTEYLTQHLVPVKKYLQRIAQDQANTNEMKKDAVHEPPEDSVDSIGTSH